MRWIPWVMALAVFLGGCEPQDQPGGELLEIRVVLLEKNPGIDGNYILHVGERARLRATGTYSSGREEDITLSLFWSLTPGDPATLICQQDELIGSWVLLEGLVPGMIQLRASTREQDGFSIPCSPTPDGGWAFLDAGANWPLTSPSISIEVR